MASLRRRLIEIRNFLTLVYNYRIKGTNIMNIPEIKEILRQASVEVDIQGRKHIALFESDFERVAIELTKNSKPLTDVSGSFPTVDPLDDENSDINKIGREIAEMSDEEFDANCKKIEKLLLKSKGNDR